jgi:hypothetical protein
MFIIQKPTTENIVKNHFNIVFHFDYKWNFSNNL